MFSDILIYGIYAATTVDEFVPFATDWCAGWFGRLATTSELSHTGRVDVQDGGYGAETGPACCGGGVRVGEFVAPHTAVSNELPSVGAAPEFRCRPFWGLNRDGNTLSMLMLCSEGPRMASPPSTRSADSQRHWWQSGRPMQRSQLEQVHTTRLEGDRTETESLTLRRWETEITPQL